MKTIIKNTKIGVESSVGINWDKHATVFANVQFDATLRPLNIIRPPNIQEMYNALAAHN